MFNLKSLVIKEVPVPYFKELTAYWGRDGKWKIRDDAKYGKIVNPIQYDDHEKLLTEYAQHPLAYKINVFDKRRLGAERTPWIRYLKPFSEEKLKELAEIASNDERKRGYLEVKFFDPIIRQKKNKNWVINATMGFAEVDGLITSYELSIPFNLADLVNIEFDTPAPENFKKIDSIWVPD